MEHRKSTRIPLRQRIDVESRRAGPPITAWAHDMSLGGMFIETDSPVLRVGVFVTVAFALPRNGSQDRFVLEAEVVRQAPDGVGLMFTSMGAEEIRSLSEALPAQQVAWPRVASPVR